VLKGLTKSCGCITKELSIHKTELLVSNARKARIDGTNIHLINTARGANVTNKLGVRGVSLKDGMYVARITFKKKTYFLGAYETIEQAKLARAQAEAQFFTPFLEEVKSK